MGTVHVDYSSGSLRASMEFDYTYLGNSRISINCIRGARYDYTAYDTWCSDPGSYVRIGSSAVPETFPRFGGGTFKNMHNGDTITPYITSSSGIMSFYASDGNANINKMSFQYNITVSHTVAFDANGGWDAPGAVTKTSGTTLYLPWETPSATGHNFGGWATYPGGPWAYGPGGAYDHDQEGGTVTLYAIWSPWVHTVAFDANGGSNAPGAITKTYCSGANIPLETPSRSYSNFGGWATYPGGPWAYGPGSPYYNDQNGGTVTLYAIWNNWAHTVTFDANGGSGAPNSITKVAYSEAYIPQTIPTRRGFEFLGWSVSSTATEPSYSAGSPYVHDQDGGTVTLYAVWKRVATIVYVKEESGWVKGAIYAKCETGWEFGILYRKDENGNWISY